MSFNLSIHISEGSHGGNSQRKRKSETQVQIEEKPVLVHVYRFEKSLIEYNDPNFAKFILPRGQMPSSGGNNKPYFSFCSTQNDQGDKRFIAILRFRTRLVTKTTSKANKGGQEYFDFGDIIDKDNANSEEI